MGRRAFALKQNKIFSTKEVGEFNVTRFPDSRDMRMVVKFSSNAKRLFEINDSESSAYRLVRNAFARVIAGKIACAGG